MNQRIICAIMFCALVAFVSCSKEKEDEVIDEKKKNYYSYDGVEKEIAFAAYYLHDTDGYQIVFSPKAGVTDFDDYKTDFFSMEVPYDRTGRKLDFATDEVDGEEWNFYGGCWFAASEAWIPFYTDIIVRGTVSVTVASDGTFEIELDAVDKDEKVLKAYYKGKPVKKDDFIMAWG